MENFPCREMPAFHHILQFCIFIATCDIKVCLEREYSVYAKQSLQIPMLTQIVKKIAREEKTGRQKRSSSVKFSIRKINIRLFITTNKTCSAKMLGNEFLTSFHYVRRTDAQVNWLKKLPGASNEIKKLLQSFSLFLHVLLKIKAVFKVNDYSEAGKLLKGVVLFLVEISGWRLSNRVACKKKV